MNSLETVAILRHSGGFSRRFAFVLETLIHDLVALLLLLFLTLDNWMCVNLTVKHS